MEKRLQILVLAVAATLSSAALADGLRNPTADKPNSRIDFNKMIDENNTNKKDLQKSVVNEMDVSSTSKDGEEKDDSAEAASQKKKLMDFVDVEVGVGQEHPTVVDRRYNSVGEARIAPEFSNAKVTAPGVTDETPKGDGGT